MRRPTSTYLKGAVFGFVAVSIWASWSAVTRLAVTTQLDAWDISALRFGVPGLLLLPVVIKRGIALPHLGWRGLAILVVGGGVPYVFLAAAGLRFAPAHHQAALNPGFMPIFVTLMAAYILGEKLSTVRKQGLWLILAGALIIVVWHDATWSRTLAFGHALFLSAGLLWACFTVMMRQAKIDPLHATALVSTGSAVCYLPIYFTMHKWHLIIVPLPDLVIQALFQGILVTILSLVLYARSVEILGASGGAAFGALVPTLSALIAIPLLGEWPSHADWVAMALVSTGVYLASGGPLPRVRRSSG